MPGEPQMVKYRIDVTRVDGSRYSLFQHGRVYYRLEVGTPTTSTSITEAEWRTVADHCEPTAVRQNSDWGEGSLYSEPGPVRGWRSWLPWEFGGAR